jgi:hypothetical protein
MRRFSMLEEESIYSIGRKGMTMYHELGMQARQMAILSMNDTQNQYLFRTILVRT